MGSKGYYQLAKTKAVQFGGQQSVAGKAGFSINQATVEASIIQMASEPPRVGEGWRETSPLPDLAYFIKIAFFTSV